jgi:hypothetical protein
MKSVSKPPATEQQEAALETLARLLANVIRRLEREGKLPLKAKD